MKQLHHWIGLDYGSQGGNTTAIASFSNGIHYSQSNLDQKTDDWILEWLEKHPDVKYIFIDAPLSLPASYFGKGEDFMYRMADRQVSAMSPMFLGGLTARAMRLKHSVSDKSVKFLETYPAHLEKILFDSKTPKKHRSISTERVIKLQEKCNIQIQPPENRHQYDALLAWVSGFRYFTEEHITFGDPQEGQIIV